MDFMFLFLLLRFDILSVGSALPLPWAQEHNPVEVGKQQLGRELAPTGWEPHSRCCWR